MSEIEIMFNRAGLFGVAEQISSTGEIFACKPMQFTAEKQIELIKWLLQNKRLCIRKAEHSNNFYMDTLFNRLDGVDNKDFEQCLASLVNNLWQDLTLEEKLEIMEILKG